MGKFEKILRLSMTPALLIGGLGVIGGILYGGMAFYHGLSLLTEESKVNGNSGRVETVAVTVEATVDMDTLYDTVPIWKPDVEKISLPRVAVDELVRAMEKYSYTSNLIHGQPVGHVIGEGDDAALALFSLRPGEILVDINGIPLNSQEALDAVRDVLGRAALIQMIVLRGANRVVLNFTVDRS